MTLVCQKCLLFSCAGNCTPKLGGHSIPIVSSGPYTYTVPKCNICGQHFPCPHFTPLIASGSTIHASGNTVVVGSSYVNWSGYDGNLNAVNYKAAPAPAPTVTCPDCKGTGRYISLTKNEPCAMCKGSCTITP